MKHYLLVHSRSHGDDAALPVSGTVHDVDSAEDAIAFLENDPPVCHGRWDSGRRPDPDLFRRVRRKRDASTQRHPVSLEVRCWYIIRDGLGPIDIALRVRIH